MNYLLVAALAVALLANLVQAIWKGADDSGWELRYRTLDDLDQAWIAAASTTRASLPELEERGQVAGLVPAGFLGAVFGGYGLVAGSMDIWRDRRLKSEYREVQDRYLAPDGVTSEAVAAR